MSRFLAYFLLVAAAVSLASCHTYETIEGAEDDDPKAIAKCDDVETDGVVDWVEVEPCEWGKYGCDFIKGDYINFKAQVTSGADVGVEEDEGYNMENVIAQADAKVGFFNDRYPHFDQKVCAHTECPFKTGESKIIEWKELNVPENFPSTHGHVKITIKDTNTDAIVACGRFGMRYRKPGDAAAAEEED